MNARILRAALAAAAVGCLPPTAFAGCVIAPGGKSINVITDNGSSAEKNCSVTCQVDTKIGVVQIGCGGNAPPRAKAHSLCDFHKPELWYKKVISAVDSCKGEAASAAPAPIAAAAPAVKPGTFICRIAADGKSFDAMIANPYKADASCQVNCQIATTNAGTTLQSSCTKSVAPGVGAVVLCTQTFDKGKLVRVVGGSGSCTNPEVPAQDADKDDDDDAEALANDPAKMLERMRKQLPPDAQRMLDKMNKQ